MFVWAGSCAVDGRSGFPGFCCHTILGVNRSGRSSDGAADGAARCMGLHSCHVYTTVHPLETEGIVILSCQMWTQEISHLWCFLFTPWVSQ